MAAKKVLFIQTAFLGDVVLATALVEKWRSAFADDEIDLLVRKGSETLLAEHPHIREVLVWDKRHKWRDWWRLWREVRRSRYDLVINLQRYGSMAALTALSGAKERIGFDTHFMGRWGYTRCVEHLLDPTGKTPSPHETERNQQLIAEFTDATPALPRLYPQPKHIAEVDTLRRSLGISEGAAYYCLFPSSVWQTKALPAERWAALIATFSEDTQVLLLGGKGDANLCECIRQMLPAEAQARAHNACGRLSLLASAHIMQAAKMNYTNDSAPLHLASAMNAPLVAFFCSTVPNFGFTPLSDTQQIAQVDKPLACRPCGVHGKKQCPLGHFACGQIDVGGVLR